MRAESPSPDEEGPLAGVTDPASKRLSDAAGGRATTQKEA